MVGAYQCPNCQESFKTSQALGGHMRTHYHSGKKKLGKKRGRPKKVVAEETNKKSKTKNMTVKPPPQIFEIVPEDSSSDDAVVIPIKIRIIVEVVRE